MIYFPFPYQGNHAFSSSVSPLMCNPLPAFSSWSASGNSVSVSRGEAGSTVSARPKLGLRRNFIVTGLQDIDKCRQQLHDITVPLEVFEYIDQGRNPQLYTKECLERALAKNEQVKGKIDTMKPWFHEDGDEDGDVEKSPWYRTACLDELMLSNAKLSAQTVVAPRRHQPGLKLTCLLCHPQHWLCPHITRWLLHLQASYLHSRQE
nr:mediator of RNA polymerase II transcription subunit 10 isoform X1 [Symphalangus syndactylus]